MIWADPVAENSAKIPLNRTRQGPRHEPRRRGPWQRCQPGQRQGPGLLPLLPAPGEGRPRWHRVAGTALVMATLAGGPASVGAQDLQAVAGRAPSEGQRVVLITGSTGGLGREVARRLAAAGDHVIVHGRDVDRGSELVVEIQEMGSGSARFYAADLASFDEVRALAQAIRRDYRRLDVLVNNAGIWLEGPRRLSADGHELHFQVNYLSGFLLTRQLLPLLKATGQARVVNVSSGAQRAIDFDDVMLEDGYSDTRAYAQSKLAQVMFTFDLATELEGTGVIVNALHPATMMDTGMVLDRGAQTRASVHDGAEAVMHLIDSSGLGSGGYFNQTAPARANAQAYDVEARARLRALSEKLTGESGS
jgi:NAD(P)-dependent dehydrogenase (short-subunit alcohol dehydrogenase family)